MFLLEKSMPISLIVENSPRAVELLTEYGLSCMNCFLNQFDTLENGAMIHNMTEEYLEFMIDEINGELIKEHEKQKLNIKNKNVKRQSKM